MNFIKNPNDMKVLFDPKSPIFESCIDTLCTNLDELVQRITEFMVTLCLFIKITRNTESIFFY